MFHKSIKKIASKLLPVFSKRNRSTVSDSFRFSSINELLDKMKNESSLSDQPENVKLSITFKEGEFKVATNTNIDKLYAIVLANCASHISEDADNFSLFFESPRYDRSKVKIEEMYDLLLLMSDVYATKYRFEENYKARFKI